MEEIPPSPSCCYKNLSPSALSFLLLQALLEHAEVQKSLTARSQAVERTDKLPECVLSRRSKHAKRYSCRVPLSGLDMRLELKSRSRCVGIDCSGSDSAKLPMVASGI